MTDITKMTIADAVQHIEAYGSPSEKQDIRKAKVAFRVHEIEGPDFEKFPADLEIYQSKIKKLTGKMPALQALIHAAGISDESYKQFWRAGRRLIDVSTGLSAEKRERKARRDDWANLLDQVSPLVKAGFVNDKTPMAMSFLIDTCRNAEVSPRELSPEIARDWLCKASTAERRNLRRGLKALDSLQWVERLQSLLPHETVAPAKKLASRMLSLSSKQQAAIQEWVLVAAVAQVEDDAYKHLAEPLSASTKATYVAALSLYCETLVQLHPEMSDETRLDRLFSKPHIDDVITLWSRRVSHEARTMVSYSLVISGVLYRNGFEAEGRYLNGITKVLPRLVEGRAAARRMSPKLKSWCEALMRDQRKTALFQIQHIEYYKIALQVLAEAKEKGLDLVHLSNPKILSDLPVDKRSEVKGILRKAKMFGLMAAYAAIALEGAPFRRMNMLSMRHTGPQKTMFLALQGRPPQVTIKFPNEELKNGKWLSMRGEELEAITMIKREKADYAVEIIDFYLNRIRPLFPCSDQTHAFFPPLSKANSPLSGFDSGTFYIWLAEASASIDLPLNSHNFRHGYCTIDINSGTRSLEDLARILGDTVAVVQRNYAWVNGKESVRNVQQNTSRRRNAILEARGQQ